MAMQSEPLAYGRQTLTALSPATAVAGGRDHRQAGMLTRMLLRIRREIGEFFSFTIDDFISAHHAPILPVSAIEWGTSIGVGLALMPTDRRAETGKSADRTI